MGKVNTGGHCPKCGGNLYLDRDYIGWYEQCLQCAYMKDLAIVYQNKIKKIAEPAYIKKVERINKKSNPNYR
jgi:DNA-directed RNA polymerase subunit M/transcription elongation factor TFIIS